MSEYQYYEFLTIDRPLTECQMRELRAASSRAVITPTRFTNHYEWGNFKGDPRAWMERYFDAYLYFANWGTHELMLRLSRRLLDPATAKRYCRGEAAAARVKGEHVILEFLSEEEGGDWFEEDEDGSLSSLVSLRADIASGDLRALYLGWLLCAQAGELDDAEEEPPCPPGLGRLSAALAGYAERAGAPVPGSHRESAPQPFVLIVNTDGCGVSLDRYLLGKLSHYQKMGDVSHDRAHSSASFGSRSSRDR